MEEYYFRITGKALPSIMEIDVHERPLQKNNILCIVLEDTSLPEGNEVYKILYHPHSDWKDFFYILIEHGSMSQSLQRHVGNLSLIEMKSALIAEKVIPHGTAFIACSCSQR